MAKNKIKNISGLLAYSNEKNKKTIEKVNQAIDKLKRSKTKEINFKTVSDEAGVSKTTLYNNDILRERIMSLRSLKSGTTSAPMDSKVDSERLKIRCSNEKIRKLQEDKKNLIMQLVEMENLKDENEKLKEIVSKLKAKK